MCSYLMRSLVGAFLCICLNLCAHGQTFTLTVPATSTNGVYTVSYTYSGSSSVIGSPVILELINGNWVGIGGGAASGSINVTKTQSGTYSYRAAVCTGSCTAYVTKSIVVTLSSSSSSASSSSSSASSDGCTAQSNTTIYCYDDLGRVKTVIHPNGVKNKYEYDAADNRTKKESTTN